MTRDAFNSVLCELRVVLSCLSVAITADKPGITHQALKRPDRPAVIAEKPVKYEVISLPATEEPVSDDATFVLPLSSKPSIEVANSTELGRSPDEEEVISPELATENTVITKLTHYVESNNSNGSLPVVDSVPKSNDSETKSNNDLLIGKLIEVTAPWGQKVSVEIVDTYIALSGQKWACFKALDESPAGWEWSGGVKRIDSLTI